MARSKAYLFGGVEIRWSCDALAAETRGRGPAEAVFKFPGGLRDYLGERLEGKDLVAEPIFSGRSRKAGGRNGSLEWAVAWLAATTASAVLLQHDPDAGRRHARAGPAHRAAARRALTYAERIDGQQARPADHRRRRQRRLAAMLSVFIREPEFQGQTKDKLATVEAARVVENAMRDPFDHWLADDAATGAETARLARSTGPRSDSCRRRQERRSPARRRRASCGCRASSPTARRAGGGSELFIVEGDSAGGSAKQARDRATQACCRCAARSSTSPAPARQARPEPAARRPDDLALGCGTGGKYREDDLRYEKVIIMTDADVDGAHIASLLVTFFWRQMPELDPPGPPLSWRYRRSTG
jgi:topoisomerase-4 subunit B